MLKLKVLSLLTIMILLLASLRSYSQKTILSKEDTLIAFNKNQSKFLLSSYYKMEKFDTLLKICEHENVLKDFIINNDSLIIQNKDIMIDNYKSLFLLKESEVFELKEENKSIVKRSNFQKKLVLILSVTSITLLSIILL